MESPESTLPKCARVECDRPVQKPTVQYCMWHNRGTSPCSYTNCINYGRGKYCWRHKPDNVEQKRLRNQQRAKDAKVNSSVTEINWPFMFKRQVC